MKLIRKAAVALGAALVLSIGTAGVAAPAHAFDTNWPCAACLRANR